MSSQASTRAGQPGITTSQLDGDSLGDISSSVNLFRGDVNLSFQLLDLPGRNQLDVAITAFYGSNVRASVQADNEAAPTGILGLGWEIPFEQIVVDAGERANTLDRDYYLVSGGNSTPLHCLGEANGVYRYQLQSDPFTRVEYLKAQERWIVTREDGSRSVYGTPPNGTDEGALQYDVAWNNWVGSSVQPGGTRFPSAWNLTVIENHFGDSIRFRYEVTEVSVGAYGPAYTRSIRLRSITDTYGREVVLNYAPKESFEIQLPHVAPIGHGAAYQFKYPTEYLASLEIFDRQDLLLFRIELDYELINASTFPEDRYRKRYLTKIRQVEAGAGGQPSLDFHYHRTSTDENPGALKTIVYPEGGTVDYVYEKIEVGQSTTRAEIQRPSPDYVPRVWHGPDYTVVAWISAAQGRLLLNVYQWSGVWGYWTSSTLQDLSLADLRVETAGEYFSVSFRDLKTKLYRMMLYRKNPYRHGEWDEHEVTLDHTFTEIVTTHGVDFVAVASPNGATMAIEQWNGFERVWKRTELPVGNHSHIALGASQNVCLGAFHTGQSLRLQLFHPDANGVWQTGSKIDLATSIDWQVTSPDTFWNAGASFATATFAIAVDGAQFSYRVVLLQWNEDFSLGPYRTYDRSQASDLDNPVLYTDISRSVIGNAQNLLRFDGNQWIPQQVFSPQAGKEYSYVYGDDIVFGVERSAAVEYYKSWAYDPYQGQWIADPLASQTVGAASSATPTIAGDYLTLGVSVYHRNAANVWKLVGTLESNFDPRTVRNRAPSYIAYERLGASSTVVQFFKDGASYGAPHVLHGERIQVEKPGRGTELTGARAFVTFKAPTLDEAAVLSLYHVADCSIERIQKTEVVKSLTIGTGYQSTSTFYSYERETARLDPSGQVAQFVRAWSMRGDAGGAEGRSEYVYFNGLNPNVPNVDYPSNSTFTNARDFFSILSGSLFCQIDRDGDGKLVNSAKTYFYVYDTSRGKKLNGAYVRVRKQEAIQHLLLGSEEIEIVADGNERGSLPGLLSRLGIEASTDSWQVTRLSEDLLEIRDEVSERTLSVFRRGGRIEVYADVTSVCEQSYNELGQISEAISRFDNSQGKPEALGQQTRYAWEFYPGIYDAHLYSAVAEETKTNVTAGVITARSVTTYRKDWNGGALQLWTNNKAYVWNGDAGTESFDYAAWSGDEEPSRGWIRYEKVLAIDSHGLSLEVSDVDGNRTAHLYDIAGSFIVASFDHTSLLDGQGSYYGFEDYESPQGWVVEGAGPRIEEGDAYSGRKSLVLPGNSSLGAGLRAAFNPEGSPGKFLLSCWVKETLGQSAAGWSIKVDGAETFVPFPATNGRWTFFHTVVPSGSAIELLVSNPTAQTEVLVDGISFLPLGGRLGITVVDDRFYLPTASLTATGGSTFYSYNRRHELSAQIGDEGRPKTITADHRWRRFRAGAFEPADPNSTITLELRSGGDHVDFHRGGEWRNHWTPSGDWTLSSGKLVHNSNSAARIVHENDPTASYALLLNLELIAEVEQPIGIEVPDAFRVEWMDGRWTLYAPDGTIADTLIETVLKATEWLLLVTEHSVQFYADGRRVLAGTFDAMPAGRPEFFATDPVAVSSLTFGRDPVAQTAFYDNVSNAIQSQSLDDRDVLTASTLYDSMGRAAISTKRARKEKTLFGYRSKFVEAVDWTTGLMSGEIVEAYPEDKGYPYARIRFERSPSGRQIQSGSPGREFAIVGSDPFQAHTGRDSYQTNRPLPHLEDLPAGQYLQIAHLDADDVTKTSVYDRAGREIAAYVGNPSPDGTDFALTRNDYDVAGRVVETRLPNFFSKAPDAASFRQTMAYDFLGRVTGVHSPNSSTEHRRVYDDASRLRFALDSDGKKEGYLLYRIYDSIGRMTEQGYCDAQWDEKTLIEHANDSMWLPAAGVWQKRLYYDGDGTDVDLLGQIDRAETVSSVPGCTGMIVESFRYTKSGNLARRTTTLVDGAHEETHAVAFEHDNLGNLTEIVYDADEVDPPLTVRYRYDAMGLVERIEARNAASDAWRTYARYQFGPNGELDMEEMDPDGASPIPRRYEYNSPRWLSRIEDPWFEQKIGYTEGGYEGSGYRTGKMAHTVFRFAEGVGGADFVREYGYEYSYDRLGRLQAARNTVDDVWSYGVGAPPRYDANGNLLSVSEGDRNWTYTFHPGTDKVHLAEDQSVVRSFQYNEVGSVRSMEPEKRILSYDRASAMTARIERPSGDTTFLYDATDVRRLKRNENGSTLYILGEQSNPLIEITRQPSGVTQRLCIVHGPLGPFSLVLDGEPRFLIRDHLGSVRAVVEGDDVVAAYNYQAFGDFLGPVFEPSEPCCRRLFTGQELDRETGLYNFNARLYDPRLRRFLSVDTDNSLGSPYTYSGNDPVDFNDPSGNFPFAVVGVIVLAVIGAYWGGVKSNDLEPNPAKWDWTSWQTYVEIGVTSLSFALAGRGAAISVTGLTVRAGTRIVVQKIGTTLAMEAADGIGRYIDAPHISFGLSFLSIGFSLKAALRIRIRDIGLGLRAIGVKLRGLGVRAWRAMFSNIPKPPPLPNWNVPRFSLPGPGINPGSLQLGALLLKPIPRPPSIGVPDFAKYDFAYDRAKQMLDRFKGLGTVAGLMASRYATSNPLMVIGGGVVASKAADYAGDMLLQMVKDNPLQALRYMRTATQYANSAKSALSYVNPWAWFSK